jgi:glucose-6-phosphate isomerase
MGINTYDQPAVELGKEATFALMGHDKYKDLLKKINDTCKADSSFEI